jgi:hypothetical protein
MQHHQRQESNSTKRSIEFKIENYPADVYVQGKIKQSLTRSWTSDIKDQTPKIQNRGEIQSTTILQTQQQSYKQP